MTNLDIILLVGLLGALIYGYFMGLISMIASLLSFCIGLWVSAKFGAPVKNFLIENVALANNTATLLTLILFIIPIGFLMHWSGKVAEKVLKFLFLNWVNKASGMLIAFLVMLILESVAVKFAVYFPVEKPWISAEDKRKSKVYPILYAITPDVLPNFKSWIIGNISPTDLMDE